MFKYLITMMLVMVMSVVVTAEISTSANSPPGVEISYDQADGFFSSVAFETNVLHELVAYRQEEVPYIRAGELKTFANTTQLSQFMFCCINNGNSSLYKELDNKQNRHYTLIGYSIWN